jgi:PAS domain S-box-containing protein
MSHDLNILLLEDSMDDALLIIQQLILDGFRPLWQRVDSENAYLNHLHDEYDVILSDYVMPQFDAPRALALLQAQRLDIPFIVVTGHTSEEMAVACIRQGAADYLLKDRMARLSTAISNALAAKRLRQQKQQAEEALREREACFRLLTENSPDIIFRYRRFPTAGFEYISPAVTSVLGYQPEDYYATADFWKQTVVPQDRALIERILADEDIRTVDVRHIRQDGSTLWLELKLVPLYDEQGVRIGTEGVARDITERVHMQSRLEEEHALLEQRVTERSLALSAVNDELARLARAKDEFLANMSHELRTPLSSVLGFAESLQEEVFGPLTDKQRQYLAGIEESGRHLLDLINDILDVAKVEYGNLQLDYSSVSVAAICQASLRLIRQIAHKKAIEVFLSCDEAITTLWADERRLKQILVNLLSNAVKFTPTGGKIGLEVTCDPEQQIVQFAVWDTGIGISRDDMDYLFKPFLQLDSSRSREFGGTGLGLALVYRMTELHGGGVAVESKVGQGSRFIVTLPQIEPSSQKQHAVELHRCAADYSNGDGMSKSYSGVVLLAEDDEQNITVFSDYLSTLGFEIVVARNGSEAIAQAQTLHPDVILMDIQMPGMDGYETIRHMRADARLRLTPLIALTALVMPGDKESCLAVGATAYLSKPVRLSHLAAVIHKQVAHRI